MKRKSLSIYIVMATFLCGASLVAQIGREVAIPNHVQDGDEYVLSLTSLIAEGRRLFMANWTGQEGGGRPLTKGTGAPLVDQSSPLVGARSFNRVSAPDANSCAGCHNSPVPGGGGDIVANVFVLGHRFDFASFEGADLTPTRGAVDENGLHVTLQSIANSRATLGMNGSGYIEMLAREMTTDLQSLRNSVLPGGSIPLVTKGISFGTLSRAADGTWITSAVEGLVAPSLASTGSGNPPSLIIRPFHQASNVISLRQFTNNAMNHHHGIQTTERFGIGTDPDGDGFTDEMTRADVTATSIFQATMAVPGRVIPDNPEVEAAVLLGEQRFASIGCASCHVPALRLSSGGRFFSEPNPFNPAGNLRPGDAASLSVDLSDTRLPTPRLPRRGDGSVMVPAFTDLKVHDITSGPGDPNREGIDMNQPGGSAGFFAGNGRFITRKLWGIANEAPFFHHGMFTTMRQAVLAHAGEAQASHDQFVALPEGDQDAVIEFLKTLQVLRPGTRSLVVNENQRAKIWPPR